MRYTVIWQPRAVEELAKIWGLAADRAGVTRAADNIDRLLGDSPAEVGESRPDNFRTECIVPLAFIFKVSEPDRMVWVVRIWSIR